MFPDLSAIEDELKASLEGLVLSELGEEIEVHPTSLATSEFIQGHIQDAGIILLNWGGAMMVEAGEASFPHSQSFNVVVIEQTVDSTLEHKAAYPIARTIVNGLHEGRYTVQDPNDENDPPLEVYMMLVTDISPVDSGIDGYYSCGFTLAMIPAMATLS